MKKLTIKITMDDDAPEGIALLDALGELVKQVPVIVEQKTRVVEADYSEYGVRCECKWMTPNAALTGAEGVRVEGTVRHGG